MRYIFFLFIEENICCGYSLEAPRRGASNEYAQYNFSSIDKKKYQFSGKLILVEQVDFDR